MAATNRSAMSMNLSPQRAEAARSLRTLSAMMDSCGRYDHSERLARRSEAVQASNDVADYRRSASPRSHEDGPQSYDELVAAASSPSKGHHTRNGGPNQAPSLAVESMASLAEMHSARGNVEEAERLLRRVIELVNAAAAVDASGGGKIRGGGGRAAVSQEDSVECLPFLKQLGDVLERGGNQHEATCVRRRMAELMDLHVA